MCSPISDVTTLINGHYIEYMDHEHQKYDTTFKSRDYKGLGAALYLRSSETKPTENGDSPIILKFHIYIITMNTLRTAARRSKGQFLCQRRNAYD